MKTLLVVFSLVFTLSVAARAQSLLYLTDPLTSSDSNWTQNGPGTYSSSGLTSSTAATLVSTSAPATGNNYEIRMQLNLTQSGGYYSVIMRATTGASVGSPLVGTYYGFDVYAPTFTNGVCTGASLYMWKVQNGSSTTLTYGHIPCQNGMIIRGVVKANTIIAYVDINGVYTAPFFAYDSSITSGLPGVSIANSPAGNSISNVQIYNLDTIPPNAINAQTVGVSSFPNRVDLQWQGVTDNTGGIGLYAYQIYRSDPNHPTNVFIGGAFTPTISDETVAPSVTYTYTLQSVDWHWNVTSTVITVNTPPAGDNDPRQVGVRPTGSYWGGGGENLDMRSGNLNFTVPLLTAQGRGGWTVPFNLTYNSENWREDTGGTWLLGRDEGYGFGWKLLAGSITPYYSGFFVLDHFVFTDASGAEYRLDQNPNNAGVWSTLDAAYVWYDSNAQVLHFADGTFWTMGSLSSGMEEDAGTIYPTVMEDTNGNQISIAYNPGMSLTAANSSGRINYIQDVRATSMACGICTYEFSYDLTSPTLVLPHLTGITTLIGTDEGYTFSYASQTLQSPFGQVSYGSAKLLQSLTNYNNLTTQMAYTTDNSGGLAKVTMPYGGYLRWVYIDGVHPASRTQMEVSARYLPKTGGESTYNLTFDNSGSAYVRAWAMLQDVDGNAEKKWTFQTNSTQLNAGMVTAYQEYDLPSGNLRLENDYTWSSTPTSAKPFISQVVTTMDGVSKQTNQSLDQYGNLTQMLAYNWGATTVTRTYTNTYLLGASGGYSSAYNAYYIFNRLLTSAVTDGTKSTVLVTNTYDNGATTFTNQSGIQEHDSKMNTTWSPRGVVLTSATPSATTTYQYDIAGNVTQATKNGVQTTVTTSSGTNFAAPSAITTNYTSSMTWSSFLGLSSATGPNGDSASISYDGNGRPYTTWSPYGAVTNYTYNDTASPPTRTATTNTHFVTTSLDGFGRTIQTDSGDTTSHSRVQMQYAACGCSPLGKLYRQSEPYDPNANGGNPTIYWTTYTYDGSGRTTKATLADNSVTGYSYSGNTVTVTDPVGNWKKFTMDAFGNLTQVVEPDGTQTNTNGQATTTYTYDILNHLIGVSMPRQTPGGSYTQTRTFNYATGNTVGPFLLSATNPENGTVTYSYNTLGLVATKTDAKGQELKYAYDTYGRLLTVSLAGSPDTVLRTYTYDTNSVNSNYSQYAWGRLTTVTYSVPAIEQAWDHNLNGGNGANVNFTGDTVVEMYNYTQPGQVAGKQLLITRQNSLNEVLQASLSGTWGYNNEGTMVSAVYPGAPGNPSNPQAYPGPPTYTYTTDTMGRLNGMTQTNLNTEMSQNGPWQVASGGAYNAAGQLEQIDWNGIGTLESRQYNTLGQLTNITAGSLNLTYNYTAGQNNGKISSQTDNWSGETVTYAYDTLNRLISAQGGVSFGQSGTNWGQGFQYDPFGNLSAKTVLAGSAPTWSAAPDVTTNRVGATDANGNSSAYGWDAENRLVASANPPAASYTRYAYDGQNKQIWSCTWNTASSLCTTDNGYSFYSPAGKLLGTFSVSFTPYYYVNNGNGYQLVPDSLTITNGTPLAYFGSRRLWTPDRVGSQGRFFPYGEDRTGMNYPQSGQYSFATYLDNGSGVYYADQRWYAAAPGRFLSPDRHRARSRTRSPQNLNLFSYTGNDPINRADPSGLAYCDVDFGICYYGDDDDDDDDDDDCVGTEGFSYVTGASCPVGNAPPQPDPIDCDIQLLTQDAVFQGDPAQHTILEVEIPDANSYFLEAGPVPFTRLGIAGPSWLNASVETTAPMYHLPTTAIYGWEEPESVCERLLTTFGSYKQNTILYNNIPTAVFWGPNSNSFTHSLLNTAGLSVPWWMSPWLLVYAPGWINTSVPF